jgi:excisionase family DNA binding protein
MASPGRKTQLQTSWAEPFVDRREIARMMGVSIATIDRLVAEGMPSQTWGRRTRRFKPSEVLAWAKEREAA